MTSALYLEHYLDGLEHLPNELQRNFTLMRELDSRAQTLMKSIDEKADEFMKTLVKDKDSIPEEARKEKLKAIQDMFNKAKEYGDDKVQLAIQTYELVDKHIRRLDSDLARFEGEIQDKTLTAAKTTKTDESAPKRGRKRIKDIKVPMNKKKRAAPSALSSEEESRAETVKTPKSTKKQKKTTETEEPKTEPTGHTTPHPSDVLDMPVDPNEPTYCVCQQVSYGEMIGCDNTDCPIEWFHFACVGLTTKPKGKWFCPKCSQDRKKK
ncbi:inhibitor of growth protein 4 isoform X2 [Contarinia nasturtii]|uniref:inhibitor of growth protein 4 isoform X2 n=1 Tax=Contarinia nasturtii TaxID=265458 RepID=UPI0012D4A32D|nr:inhibitor of growth protein 4 isoform X2 [Contarinia nasturtii]